MAFSFIQHELAKRASQSLQRRHAVVDQEHDGIINIDGCPYINFSSNDYLGMRHNPAVLQGWVEGLALYGGGSGASPLVTGYTRAHAQLCEVLAELLNREAVLLFSSGFAANQAICQALLRDQTRIFMDKLSHASLLEGATNSRADVIRFQHNDMQHLTNRLTSDERENTGQNECKSDRLIATEGIFSMDGDQAPMPKLIALAEQHDSWLMVDDAHGFGVAGERGEGVAASFAGQSQCQIIMATFGKACGTAGAFVAGGQPLIDYLLNFAKHYVYSTAMPPAQAYATRIAVEQIKQGGERSKLAENIALFREKMAANAFSLGNSESAIQPLIIGDPSTTLKYSDGLKQRGIWVVPIRYPTVPKGTDRLRITLSSHHREGDITALVDALCLVRDAL